MTTLAKVKSGDLIGCDHGLYVATSTKDYKGRRGVRLFCVSGEDINESIWWLLELLDACGYGVIEPDWAEIQKCYDRKNNEK